VIVAVFASVLLLGLNAGFVALEFALVGARRGRLEPLAAGGSRGAELGLAAMRDLNRQLAGAQLGITLASLSLGYVAEPLVVHALEDLLGLSDLPEVATRVVAIVAGLGVVVFAHLVVGEMAPKNVAITAPERTLVWLARPNRVYLWVVGPIVWFLTAIANAAVRLLGIRPRSTIEEGLSAADLSRVVAELRQHGAIEADAAELLTGVLDFGGRTAASVMVPAPAIVSVPAGVTAGEAEALVASSGHSRLPVVDPDSGEPLGFIHAKDLLALSAAAATRPLPLRLVRRMPVVVPEARCEDLLVGMRRLGVHVAAVVANGTVVGLVTLEDLLEELVGEITDESDPDTGEPTGAHPPRG
jgi:CBS domain containing-hemolysin-like protein